MIALTLSADIQGLSQPGAGGIPPFPFDSPDRGQPKIAGLPVRETSRPQVQVFGTFSSLMRSVFVRQELGTPFMQPLVTWSSTSSSGFSASIV